MKKIISVLIVLLICGCSKEDYYVCTIDLENDSLNYELKGTYKVYYDSTYVTKVEKKETYKSIDDNIIKYFDELKKLDYEDLNKKYDGYVYNIDTSKGTVKLNATIDLNEVDVKKMVKDDYIDKDYTISNKVTIMGLKYFYESKGAKCDI